MCRLSLEAVWKIELLHEANHFFRISYLVKVCCYSVYAVKCGPRRKQGGDSHMLRNVCFFFKSTSLNVPGCEFSTGPDGNLS